MTETEEFWAPRNSFLPLLPEHDQAADFLSAAADAILGGKIELARKYVILADFQALREFAQSIMGSTVPAIHRNRDVPGAPSRKTGTRRVKIDELRIFKRDGWRCRFCGVRVISLNAVKRLNTLFKEEVRYRHGPERKMNGGVRALIASADHLLPHSRGGTNDPENLVTACWPCQFGRNQWTLEEVGFTDPRTRPPVVDAWDGLMRLIA